MECLKSRQSSDAALTSLADFMNNVFRCLVIEDSLHLSRYVRFENILDRIDLDNTYLCVYFKTTTGGVISRKFKHSNNGKVLGPEIPVRSTHAWHLRLGTPNFNILDSVEDNILENIVGFVNEPLDDFIIDLTIGKAYGFQFFAVPELDRAVKRLLFSSDVTYQLTTKKTKTTFVDFDVFDDWCCYYSRTFLIGSTSYLGRNASHDIIFNFDVASGTALNDMQINIKDLLMLHLCIPMGGSTIFRNVNSGEE